MTSLHRIAETDLPNGWRLGGLRAKSTHSPGKYAAHATDYFDNFRELVRRWRLEIAASSSVMEMIENNNFKQIVDLGPRVAPLIVNELRAHRDFLFMALSFIFPDENPIPEGAKGKPHDMINAWLRWAERNRINAN